MEQKNNKKWLPLFALLFLFSMVLFVVLVGFVIWFWILLILWIVFLIAFWFRLFILGFKFLFIPFGLIFFLTIILSFTFAISRGSRNKTATNNPVSNTSSSSGSVSSNDCSEWVDYTGPNSQYFTFKYPKCYTIDENERSTWVNNDKLPKYDDHIVFSWIDGPANAYSCAGSTSEGETLLYSKSVTLAGIAGCESSRTKMKSGSPDLFTLLSWDLYQTLNQTQRTWLIVSWARTQSDMDIFRKMAESLVIK